MDTSIIGAMDSPAAIFANWLSRFGDIVQRRDVSALARLFPADGYWRDILAFTWEHRTFAGPDEVRDAFAASAHRVGMKNVRLAAGRAAPRAIRRSGRSLVEGYFDFDTEVGSGVGYVRLMSDPGKPGDTPVWLLLTTLHAIRGFEEKVGANRPTGEEYSRIVSPENWHQVREREKQYADRDPQVVIVGAGQGGLILAARLRQMGVDTLVIEKTERVGDVWRKRYNNLTLHNEVIANHFPYMPFPETWPFWLPKDMLAGWLESYAESMELNVWTSTQLEGAHFDEAAKEWNISVKRGGGESRSMSCSHLVMASGVSGGAPRRGTFAGLDDFQGTAMHSSQFKSGAAWAGKHAIVVGTGNSGHDVAQDLYVSGAASVSLMQRGATCVVSLDPSARISYSIYAEGISVEDADLMTASLPFPVLENTYKWVTKMTSEYDRELLRKLDEAGFKTHSGEDEAGFQMLYLRGAGGYYIDVGCCGLIIDKKVRLLQASDAERFVAGGLQMKNGDVVPADLVVLATGFEGIQHSVRTLLGDQVADKIGPAWGFDQDYVMRNMWRRTAQEGLWLMGGAIVEARLQSRFLALEIRAALEGLLPDRGAMPLVKRPARN